MLRGALQCLLQRPHFSISLLLGPEQQCLELSALCSSATSGVWSALLGGVDKPQLGIASARKASHQRCAAAYSTDAVVQEQPEQQKQMPQPAMPDNWRPFFHNGGHSRIQSRKPAIKRPARHQWHFCDPNYDPWDPLPKQNLPPYAPPRAYEKDYRAIYFAEKPPHNRKHYRRMWQKNEAIREQRWKQQWEARLAGIRKADAKVKRMAERIIRQRTWEVYKADPAGFIAAQLQLEEQSMQRRRQQQQQSSSKQEQLAPEE